MSDNKDKDTGKFPKITTDETDEVTPEVEINIPQKAQQKSNDPLGLINWTLAGRYKISKYIACGGFGEVYQGYNIHLVEQQVVIKFLKNTQAIEKIDKEAKILSVLNHPNICGIIDFFPHEHALVVPFINGSNCEEIIINSGILKEKNLKKVINTVLDALVFAHKHKIAHRDIKPSNIMIDTNGHVYLIDFGIAKQIGGTLTKTGYRAMTPQFAAPERHRDKTKYNPFMSDIYEMGITFYYLMAGYCPYRDAANPIFSTWGGPADRRISNQVIRILKKATHPDPKKRYQTSEEFASKVKNVKQFYSSSKIKQIAFAAIIILLLAAGYNFKDNLLGIWTEMVSSISLSDESNAKEDDSIDLPATEDNSGESDKSQNTIDKPLINEQNSTPNKSTSNKSSNVQKPSVTINNTKKEPELKTPVIPKDANVNFFVYPIDNSILLVDKLNKEIGQKYKLDTGKHIIKVYNPFYPILEKNINVKNDTSIDINFDRQFSQNDSISIMIGTLPRLIDSKLSVSLNKGSQTVFDRIPGKLILLEGKWMFDFSIDSPNNINNHIDSIIITPGVSSSDDISTGSKITIDFSKYNYNNKKVSRLRIYWTTN